MILKEKYLKRISIRKEEIEYYTLIRNLNILKRQLVIYILVIDII